MQHPQHRREKRHPLGKRARALILTGLVAALALAVALGVPRFIAAHPGASAPMPTAEQPYRTLATAAPAGFESVTVRHQDGEEYTLVYENGELLLQTDGGAQAIRASARDAILATITELNVEDIAAADAADVAAALPDMGLEPPRIAVTIRRDGQEEWLHLGLPLQGTTYYYYRWSGDPGVYLCDTGTYEAFESTAQMLLPTPELSVAATLLDRVTLQTRGGAEVELAFSVSADGVASATLRSPYRYPVRADSAESLLSAVANLRLGTPVAQVTAENRAALGVDDPLLVMTLHQLAGYQSAVGGDGQLTLTEAAERTTRLVVLREDGDYFYQVEYEGAVYRMSRFLLQAFVEIDPDALCTRAPADLGDAVLSSVKVQLGASMLDLRATRTERVLPNNQFETDTEGNILYDTEVTLNGAPLSPEAYEAFLARLTAMTVSGDLAEPFQPADQTARWQITLTTADSQTRVLAAYPLDAFNDALLVDGVGVHYLNSEAISGVLGELEGMGE